MAKIVHVDDDKHLLRLSRFHLERAGHTVVTLSDSNTVLAEIQRECPDLVISDIMMPGSMGGAVYQAVREQCGSGVPVIISSGTQMKVRTQGDERVRYVPKPVDYDVLVETVKELLNASSGLHGATEQPS